MKPFSSGAVIALWMLRILIAWFVYRNYFTRFTAFDIHDFDFYISAAYLLFGLLLIIGGFMKEQAMTVISGLFIFILPIVQLIRVFPEDISEVVMFYLIPLSTGFTFFTTGNSRS